MSTILKIAGTVCGGILLVMTVLGFLNRCQNTSHIKDMEKTVAIRYYLSEGDDAALYYDRVEKGKHFEIAELPYQPGKSFAGLYTAPYNPESPEDFVYAELIVDSTGNSVTTITADTVLYPVFAD